MPNPGGAKDDDVLIPSTKELIVSAGEEHLIKELLSHDSC